MDIDFLKNLGIEPGRIKAIEKTGIEIITKEIIKNRCSLNGSAVMTVELATINGVIRNKSSCVQVIEYAIKTHNL